MKIQNLLVLIVIGISMFSCSTSKVVVSHGADLSKYLYVVFGEETTGDRELDDVIMEVQNAIADTKLVIISGQEALEKKALGELILSPNINVSTEKWDGGYTYITVTFYDYDTNQSIVVLKSSGIGLTVTHDQHIAVEAIHKKLKKVFGGK